MRDSNVANAAKESTQGEFSHGLLDFCTNGNVGKQAYFVRSPSSLATPASGIDVNSSRP